MPISKELIEYYALNSEEERQKRQQLEFAVTQKFLLSWLGDKTNRILEVGAGSGFYTEWLLENGYSVTAIEPTPFLFEQLEKKVKKFDQKKRQLILGDETKIQTLDKKFDRILLMGPLYHLFEEDHRVQLLKASKNRLNPQGEIFSVFLSRIGFLSYLLNREPEVLAINPESVGSVIQNGFDPSVKPQGQFRGNFDSLNSIIQLHQISDLTVKQFLSLDPLIGASDDTFNQLDEAVKPFWVEVAYHMSTWPETLGSSRTWGFVSHKLTPNPT